MQYIVFDLEATCDKERTIKNEIIEIGAVKVNSDYEVISEFSRFVKPMNNPTLTDFCKGLTSITQDDVDNAQSLPEVLEEFLSWVGDEETIYCSWGFYDKVQIMNDCRLHKLNYDWITDNHISLKHQHYETIRESKGRPYGMAKALRSAELTLEGTHHRGIDDARNITKIFLKYKDEWDYSKAARPNLL